MEEAALMVLQRVQATQVSLTQHSSRLVAIRAEFETKAKEVRSPDSIGYMSHTSMY